MSEVAPVLNFICEHASELVAVGEVGLDFSPHVVGKEGDSQSQHLRAVQKEVFKQQIQLANELGLPVNVHSRSAGEYQAHLSTRLSLFTRLIKHQAQF